MLENNIQFKWLLFEKCVQVIHIIQNMQVINNFK